MNTHVFVVDKTTFKIHLEYMFAGTGAGIGDKRKEALFLTNADITKINATTERNLVGMIADVSRIRQGDNIIFYLQANSGNPGTFFGVFEAESVAFFDENDENNYLVDELGKGLSFRIRIKPKEVFERGISEHEYLDDLSGKTTPHQLCWSMIYRKLKGNRGCTMITSYEYRDLYDKLLIKNNNRSLLSNGFSYDLSKNMIVSKEYCNIYNGRQNNIDIKDRLIFKVKRRNAFETHLQALIMQNFDTGSLKDLLLGLNGEQVWVGNEVSCGVGMQRIDVLIIEENADIINIKVIELKDEEPYDYILDEQLPWYINWISQYMVPNLNKDDKKISICPIIIAKYSNNNSIITRIKQEKITCEADVNICNTEYIGFKILEDDIEFAKIV